MGFKRSQVQVLSPRPIFYVCMDAEKRKAARIKKPIVIRYQNAVNAGKWATTTIRDISEGGASVFVDQEFSENSTLNVCFKLPLNPLHELVLQARVISCNGLSNNLAATGTTYLVRLGFINIEEEDKQQLRDYVAWFTGKEGGRG
jgi:c-di-GMP-binding flagellar brake protein YcgR